jgi:hypothetical protein
MTIRCTGGDLSVSIADDGTAKLHAVPTVAFTGNCELSKGGWA